MNEPADKPKLSLLRRWRAALAREEKPAPAIARTPDHAPPPAEPLPAPPPQAAAEQTTAPVTKTKKKTRSGSQTRQRQWAITVNCTADEHAALVERAKAAGLSVAAYIRAVALGSAGIRAKRAPPVNRELLADALAALNRVGNNINQIAHHLNTGGTPNSERIDEAGEAVKATLRAILAALGKAAR